MADDKQQQDFLLNQFEVLDHRSKLAHLHNHGIDLEVQLHNGNYRILLYQLYDFYVEVWYDEGNHISRLLAFNCYQKLDAFIEHIAIPVV